LTKINVSTQLSWPFTKKAFVVRGPVAMLDQTWLPTLNTNTPQEGFELAVKLSRLAVMVAQSCDDGSQRTRPMQPDDPSQLIGAAHVIALNFQTIAAANDWWRHHSPYRNAE
jgi:hypothetical protein